MTARLRRCPACRLAGRRVSDAAFEVQARAGEPWWYVECPCGARSGVHSSTLEARGEWNDLSRAAKRGMRAKRGGRAAGPFRVERAFQPWGSEAAPDFVEGTRHPWPSPRGDER